VGAGCIVFAGASVGDSARLSGASILGVNATVGARASVAGSVLMAGASVGAGARVEDSILGEGASIAEESSAVASILGNGVTIAPRGHALPPFSRLTCVPFVDAFTKATVSASPEATGAEGRGRLWPLDADEANEAADGGSDDSDADEAPTQSNASAAAFPAALSFAAPSDSGSAARALREAVVRAKALGPNGTADAAAALLLPATAAALRCPRVRSAGGAVGRDLAFALTALCAAATEKAAVAAAATRASAPAAGKPSTGGAPAAGKDAGAGDDDDEEEADVVLGPSESNRGWVAFRAGVRDLVLPRAGDAGTPPAAETLRNIALEIKSFKYAENKTFADCSRAVAACLFVFCESAFAALPAEKRATVGARAMAAASVFKAWAPVYRVFVEENLDAQIALLGALQVHCTAEATKADWNALFGPLLASLWNEEAIEDMAVADWAEFAKESKDAAVKALLQQKLVANVLSEIEEEDDDEEDSEESEAD
jgi:hypothetical protein